MAQDIAVRGETKCAVCCADLSTQTVLLTHLCKHRLCSVCWFSAPDNTHGDSPQVINHDYCGNGSCLLESKSTSKCWRHSGEGIRMLEAMLHPDVREHFAKRQMVQSRAKLHSKSTDDHYAFEMMTKVFNDRSWSVPIRYPDDMNLWNICPDDNCIVVSPSQLKSKLTELRTAYAKALNCWRKNGSGSASVADFWPFAKNNGVGNHWADVYYLHRLHSSGEYVDVTQTLIISAPETVGRDLGCGEDVPDVPDQEEDNVKRRKKNRIRATVESDGTCESDSSLTPQRSMPYRPQYGASFNHAEECRKEAEVMRKKAWEAKKRLHVDSLQMMQDEHSWNKQEQAWLHCERVFNFHQRLIASMDNPSTSDREKVVFNNIMERCLTQMEEFAQCQCDQTVTCAKPRPDPTLKQQS
eukprot:766713-Hanusia_phi.AAC.2